MNPSQLGIHLNTDKPLVSEGAQTERILEIRVQAPVVRVEHQRPKLNLGIVLDRSGSMQGEKLVYVKQAASHVLDQLTSQDQVAFVVFDDQINVLAHSMPVTDGNRFELKRLISEINAGNMTNLGDGWLTGCKEIASAAQEGSLNRALLLTDGLANVGLTDLEVLSRHALELYKDSISTSTFGVGEGFNEHLLEAMANKGGGNFYYIASPDRIPDIFLKEFNNLIGTTAQKVEIKLDLPSDITWKVLGGWAAEYKDGQLRIYVGDMLTGKLQDIYLKLHIPADDRSNGLVLQARVFGQSETGEVFEIQAKLTFQVAGQKDVEAAPVNAEVMQRFSEVELADTATEALKLEREGKRDAAAARLRDNIQRSRPFVTPQTSLSYEHMSHRMQNGMTEADRKQSQFDVYRSKRKKEQEE